MMIINFQRATKKLPPLLAGTAYEAAEFEDFEYCGAMLTGSKAILRLHLKNGTTIDLPATDEQLKDLMMNLIAAFGPYAVEQLKKSGWV